VEGNSRAGPRAGGSPAALRTVRWNRLRGRFMFTRCEGAASEGGAAGSKGARSRGQGHQSAATSRLFPFLRGGDPVSRDGTRHGRTHGRSGLNARRGNAAKRGFRDRLVRGFSMKCGACVDLPTTPITWSSWGRPDRDGLAATRSSKWAGDVRDQGKGGVASLPSRGGLMTSGSWRRSAKSEGFQVGHRIAGTRSGNPIFPFAIFTLGHARAEIHRLGRVGR
jgi:hypothetical protein